MLFSSYDLIKSLFPDDNVAYLGDNSNKNNILYVQDVYDEKTLIFVLDIRTVPNRSTSGKCLIERLRQRNNTTYIIEIDDIPYKLWFVTDDIQYNGIDDKQRTSYSLNTKITINKGV